MKKCAVQLKITAGIALALFGAKPALAYDLSPQCHDAVSTAAQIQCMNDVLEKQKNDLNKVYEEVLGDAQEDQIEATKKIQQSWVAYRDHECALETTHADSASLERLASLACLSDLTNNRIQTLTRVEKAEFNDIGIMPRWMNVLAEQEKSVFWNYADRIAVDLNCDGQREYIMSGIKPSQETTEDQFVIAIAESARTGKPKTSVLYFGKEQGDAQFCNSDIIMTISQETAAEDRETCQTFIKVSDNECLQGNITWQNNMIEWSSENNEDPQIPLPTPKPDK